MKNFYISTRRTFTNWPSWHLVFEWEDEFAEVLGIPIKSDRRRYLLFDGKVTRKITSLSIVKETLQYCSFLWKTKTKVVSFEMLAKKNFSYSNGRDAVPIVIDYFSRDIKSFVKTYKLCPLVCISSKEVYNYLVEQGCPVNIRHLPLSLPSKYRFDPQVKSNKIYDVVLAGRRNTILWNFLLMFEKKYPNIEYVYQEEIDGKLFYKSNKTGIIGSFHTRSEYMDLLKSSKVGFYATPGVDGGETRTSGFNPVTPRYLELIASGCQILGRYPDNEETRYYELKEFCPNINTYEEFETILHRYLNNNGVNSDVVSVFLEKHYSNKRAYLLKDYILGLL